MTDVDDDDEEYIFQGTITQAAKIPKTNLSGVQKDDKGDWFWVDFDDFPSPEGEYYSAARARIFTNEQDARLSIYM